MLKKLSNNFKRRNHVQERQAAIDLCLKTCQNLCNELQYLESTMAFNIRAY